MADGKNHPTLTGQTETGGKVKILFYLKQLKAKEEEYIGKLSDTQLTNLSVEMWEGAYGSADAYYKEGWVGWRN